jgi:hypothetical protein
VNGEAVLQCVACCARCTVMAACIGVMNLLAFAILTWKKRKGTLAEALATKNVLEPSEAIVTECAAELTVRRNQLTTTGSDGLADDRRRDSPVRRIAEH